MQDFIFYTPQPKLELIELFFVRCEDMKAQHTLAYVSISAADALVQKEPVRTFFFKTQKLELIELFLCDARR